MSADLLTPSEHAAIRHLARAWNLISSEVVGVESTRQADLAEACSHVHALQHFVMAQAAARGYPELYRLAGQSFNSALGDPS